MAWTLTEFEDRGKISRFVKDANGGLIGRVLTEPERAGFKAGYLAGAIKGLAVAQAVMNERAT